MSEPREGSSSARSSPPRVMRCTAIVGVTFAIVAAATLAASARAASAPATTQQSAPPWLSAPAATQSGHDIAVGGGIAVQADLSGARVKIFKREVGESIDTLVGEAAVTTTS